MLADNKVDPTGHFTIEPRFVGKIQQWLHTEVEQGRITLVNGKQIGVKSAKGKQILLDHLMSENFLDLDKDAYGIYIPADEILSRPKYQWFACLSSDEVLKTNPIIVKYLKSSAIDVINEYFADSEIKSVATI
jgi:hypothetical protein